MRKSYLLLLLVGNILCVNCIVAMDDEAIQLTEQERQDALKAAQEIDPDQLLEEINPDQIIKEADAALKDLYKQQQQERNDRIQWQNTVLGSLSIGNIRVGIYKQDILEGCLLGANIIADYYIYKRLYNSRISAIYEVVKEQYNELLNSLAKLKNLEETFDKNHASKVVAGKQLVEQKKKRQALGDFMRDAMRKQYITIHKNPFKQYTIVPLLASFGVEKATKALKENWIEPLHFWNGDYWRVYEKDPQGNYEVKVGLGLNDFFTGKIPFSCITALKLLRIFINPAPGLFSYSAEVIDSGLTGIYEQFLRPAKPTEQQIKEGHKQPSKWYKVLDVLYSQPARISVQFLKLGVAVKFFDRASTAIWIEYVLAHQKEFTAILQAYKQAKEFSPDPNSMVSAEESLRRFIDQAHEPISFLPGRMITEWWKSKGSATSNLALLVSLPVFALIGYKLYTFYSYLKGNKGIRKTN